MEKTITATKAVREFSEILNAIKYKGDHYTILRGGKPVASICPVEPYPEAKPLRELKRVLKMLPRLGEDAEDFGKDLKKIIDDQPLAPKESKWG